VDFGHPNHGLYDAKCLLRRAESTAQVTITCISYADFCASTPLWPPQRTLGGSGNENQERRPRAQAASAPAIEKNAKPSLPLFSGTRPRRVVCHLKFFRQEPPRPSSPHRYCHTRTPPQLAKAATTPSDPMAASVLGKRQRSNIATEGATNFLSCVMASD
jgi:hypothetical protein